MALPYVILDELSQYLDTKNFQAFCITCRDYRDYLLRDACDECIDKGLMCLKRHCSLNPEEFPKQMMTTNLATCKRHVCASQAIIIEAKKFSYESLYFICKMCSKCKDCGEKPLIDFRVHVSFRSKVVHNRCITCNHFCCNVTPCIFCNILIFKCSDCSIKYHQQNLSYFHGEYFAVHNKCLPFIHKGNLVTDAISYNKYFSKLKLPGITFSRVYDKCINCGCHKKGKWLHLAEPNGIKCGSCGFLYEMEPEWWADN